LELFRSETIPVLVATDVGARGLDVRGVGMVVSWDMPRGSGGRRAKKDAEDGADNKEEEDPDADEGVETYIHRIGRTARMGAKGVAITFVGDEDGAERVELVEKALASKLEELTLPEEKMLEFLNKVSTAKRLASMVCTCLSDEPLGETLMRL
jgi:ATP-dependent RNA helicase DDX49/DBP8